MYPNPVFVKINAQSRYTLEKVSQNVGYVYNYLKTNQSKQSPIGRKFAQSGHPGLVVEGVRVQKASSYQVCSMFGNLRHIKRK
jgi:hypothetical protein